jgi:molecular chaperone GrpE
MPRLNNGYFTTPYYSDRPRRNEIRIPLRPSDQAVRPSPRRPEQPPALTPMRRPVAEETAAPPPSNGARRAELEKIEAEAAEWKEKYLRLAAEQENHRQRLERNYAAQAQQEKERVLRDMLPLADNLERALAHAAEEEAALQKGVALTLKAFTGTLARHGVEAIAALGQPFDPNLHEAVGYAPGSAQAPGTVVAVEETGYTHGGKLLRPARVWVAAQV